MIEINRTELKLSAKNLIKEKWFNLFLGSFIVLALTGAVNGIVGLGQFLSIALAVLYIGLSCFYLNYIDNDKIDYMDIFFSFKAKDINVYIRHLGVMLLMGLFIILWTLLLIVPGIIKAIAYSQVTYIIAENPDKDIMSALKESEKMMNGYKMEYFVMQLSFIGWFLLTVITFGVAGLYVLPYYSTTIALLYRKLKPKNEIEIIAEATFIS